MSHKKLYFRNNWYLLLFTVVFALMLGKLDAQETCIMLAGGITSMAVTFLLYVWRH